MLPETLDLQPYLAVAVFFAVALGLSIAMLVAEFVVAPRAPYREKLAPYECGFAAFSDARGKFDVRFYLVAILFIIFDLEVAFLFPWAITLGTLGGFGLVSMLIFLGILTVGFLYEWKSGALDWE